MPSSSIYILFFLTNGLLYSIIVHIRKQQDKKNGSIQSDEKVYVQVCVQLPDSSDRETANLMDIKDHYHKYVVCRDTLALGNDNGIEIVHIAGFLMRDNS